MKLAARWDDIKSVVKDTSAPTDVAGCLALIRPLPIRDEEVNKLAGLLAHFEGSGPEAEVARRKLVKAADEDGNWGRVVQDASHETASVLTPRPGYASLGHAAASWRSSEGK